jgi:EmrB/QacA subfamily drug resistance transporter
MAHSSISAAPGSSHAPPDPRRWRALVLLCLAQFMLVVDVTVVNVALPSVAADLSLGRTALTWVVAAYALCFGGLLMLGGRLADLLGRRRAFLLGLAVFTAASAASGLATGAAMLIAGRVAQGAGAALLSPAAMSIITTSFHGAERHRALGVWAAIGGTGAAAGVLLGGLLTSGPGWEWVFFVNVPVGLALLVAVPLTVRRAAAPGGGAPLDVPGAVLVTGTAALLIYGLVRAGDAGWGDPLTLGALGGALLAGFCFVAVERAAAAPLIHPSMLVRRSLASGNLAMLAGSGLLLAGFFLSSQYLQNVLGLSAVRTGLAFLPVALATVVGAHLASHLIGRFGWRPVAAAGFATAALGAGLLVRLPADGSVPVDLLPGFVLLALGLGTAFVCATTAAMHGVDHHQAGLVSGIVNTSHELGAALGVAAATAIAGASLTPAVADMGGYRNAFAVFAAAAALVAVLSAWLLPPGRPDLSQGPVFAH